MTTRYIRREDFPQEERTSSLRQGWSRTGGEVTNAATKEFLATYMQEFHAFVTRVDTALPRDERLDG
jgi:hypothetical protein